MLGHFAGLSWVLSQGCVTQGKRSVWAPQLAVDHGVSEGAQWGSAGSFVQKQCGLTGGHTLPTLGGEAAAVSPQSLFLAVLAQGFADLSGTDGDSCLVAKLPAMDPGLIRPS